MSCLKFSVCILLISVAVGYYYGPQLHNVIPAKILQDVEKYIPKQVMQWMHSKSVSNKVAKDQQEKPTSDFKGKIFTKKELWDHYRGDEGSKGLCLAFMGKVYDVSNGKDHYAPGGGYSFFAGRDGTRGFVTGEFTDEGLTDNLDGLDPNLFLGFDEWSEFYESSYKYVGVVVGYFYDKNGQPTAEYTEVQKSIALAKEGKRKQQDEQKIFPPCNSEFSAAKGSRVWCSNRSGGIQRDWVGVPRLYHPTGAAEARCACVRTNGPPSVGSDTGANKGDLGNPHLREYKNCPSNAQSCVTSPPK
uniref:Neuferricin n=1 Tax=Phallusia mammillata TaxID=59560 RepID=A0A6F9DAV9_9ASCI|nr:neuferricin-like [Phallusia mammillata]